MSIEHRILIAGESRDAVAAIQGLLRGARDLRVETHVIQGRQPDPLLGVMQMPQILLLRIGAGSVRELEALAAYAPAERPPLIVIGNVDNSDCMRAAMQAGARDFLTEPVDAAELLAAINRLASEQKPAAASGRGQLTAFVNGKGGSGATFLACNIAHLFAEASKFRTVLLGIDMQFSSIARYLDVRPQRGLMEALDVVEDLDGTAIDAYLAKHSSGLGLLAGCKDSALQQQDLLTGRFETLLNLLLGNFERCVVDMPRGIEPFSAHVLERADQIVLVVQQSVPNLDDAARMYELMTRNLGVHPGRITIAVNRYRSTAAVEFADIQELFNERTLTCIPNDYRSATESIDIGVPMYLHARRSPITKALMQLEKQLGGRTEPAEKGFFPRLRLTG